MRWERAFYSFLPPRIFLFGFYIERKVLFLVPEIRSIAQKGIRTNYTTPRLIKVSVLILAEPQAEASLSVFSEALKIEKHNNGNQRHARSSCYP